MSERRGGIRAWLARPALYEAFQSAIGATRARNRLVREHIRAEKGQRVLDIGCGPGELFPLLPDVDYVGFDVNPAYIAHAQQRYGDRARFFAGDVAAVHAADVGTFDLAVAKGVLHHLPDDVAASLVDLAATVLGPQGRLVTIDPCFPPGQSRMRHWVVSLDRGTAVRSPDAYAALAHRSFEGVTPTVYDDLLRIPYNHTVLECTGPTPAGRAAG